MKAHWHLVELPKAREMSTSPNGGAGTYGLTKYRRWAEEGFQLFSATSNKHSEPMDEVWDDTAYFLGEPITLLWDWVTKKYWHKYTGHIFDDDVWSTQYHGTLFGTWLQAPSLIPTSVSAPLGMH
ncbi:hypothetical protein JTB14_019242 [Gonioctena quinquepunctata]|nr:hypothetical protein JTB14_019242 [Gonioctena quinquepunctata]